MENINLEKPGISLVVASPLNQGMGLLILSIDQLFEAKEPHSFLAVYKDGETKGLLVPSSCIDAQWIDGKGYFLGEDGYIWLYDGEDIVEHSYIDDESNIDAFSTYAYSEKYGHVVAGGGSSILTSPDAQNWASLDIPVDAPYTGFGKALIISENLYLFGWKGVGIIINDGDSKEIDLPTNLDLHDACTNNEEIYICGSQGTVIRGNLEKGWTVIENNITQENLWGTRTFEGDTFVSSSTNLYKVENDKLIEADTGTINKQKASFYGLSKCDECLWAVGAKNLYQYKDSEWRELISLK